VTEALTPPPRDAEWARAQLEEIDERIARIDQRREQLQEIAENPDHLQHRYATLSLEWDERLRPIWVQQRAELEALMDSSDRP
jgi:hypothetical protein